MILKRIWNGIVTVAIAISLFLSTAVSPGMAQDLPLEDAEFNGTITDTYFYSEADDDILVPPTDLPEGAPNVMLIMLVLGEEWNWTRALGAGVVAVAVVLAQDQRVAQPA